MGCLILCTHSCGKQADPELTLAPSLPSGLPVYSQLMRPLGPTCSEGACQPGPELGKKSKLTPPIFQATRCSRSRKTNRGAMWTCTAEPPGSRGMLGLGAQVSGAGDSEGLVPLIPFPTSFIPVSFTVHSSDGCGDPGCGGSWF